MFLLCALYQLAACVASMWCMIFIICKPHVCNNAVAHESCVYENTIHACYYSSLAFYYTPILLTSNVAIP